MKKDNMSNLNLVTEKKKALMSLRMTMAVSGAQKPHEKKLLKKEIAKILTNKTK